MERRSKKWIDFEIESFKSLKEKEGDRVCNICTDRARKLNNEEKIVENADFPDDNYDVNAHDQIVNNHDDQILVENEKSDELSSNETSSDENSEDIVNIDPTVFSLTKEQIYRFS